MSLPIPKLDDRSFTDLLGEAQLRLRQSCPGWTDASPADPGAVLLELFAHLTDTMLYRLNRVPDKAYVEFLRLLGVALTPPSAATVQLVFTRSREQGEALEIPRGTRVTSARAEAGREAPVFITLRAATIPRGATQVTVAAAHCAVVEGEDAGQSTGLPGQVLTARKPPIIAPTGDDLDLVVGVEALPHEVATGEPVMEWNGTIYRVWREVREFTGHGAEAPVYIADRMAGRIIFAPAAQLRDQDGRLEERPRAMAAIPPAKRALRLWYRHGGGPEGNLAPGRLTVMKDPIPGVTVTNPEAASNGRAAESLANALERGPYEFYSLKRAVTAFDYELIATSSGAVSRAKAYTRSSLYRHAQPGTVEVLLVPMLPDARLADRPATLETVRALQSEQARRSVLEALECCRPLGTTCLVGWTDLKPVRVKARVVVQNHINTEAVKAEVLRGLHRHINPLPAPGFPGWRFGEALRVSHLYDIILSKPGVGYVDQIRLVVDDVPDQRVAALAADPFQERTWYAAAGEQLFVSEDDGEGWQLAERFAGQRLTLVRPHPHLPGLLAVAALVEDGTRLHLSSDGGQSWRAAARTAFRIEDMAWVTRDGAPSLLIASDVGLYELAAQVDAVPLQTLVVPDNHDLGFFAVAVSMERGQATVAVAAESLGGVLVSYQGGKAGTFQHIGLRNEDVRVLAVMHDGPRSFLWAGLAAAGNENGKGCLTYELRPGTEPSPDGWRWANKGWPGGSCRALAFHGNTVLAASHRSGVMVLDSTAQDAVWQVPGIDSGLPLRDAGRLQPVDALALDPRSGRVLAGGIAGVYRDQADHLHWACCSQREFIEKVTLPATWLFCSAEHEISVVTHDEAGR